MSLHHFVYVFIADGYNGVFTQATEIGYRVKRNNSIFLKSMGQHQEPMTQNKIACTHLNTFSCMLNRKNFMKKNGNIDMLSIHLGKRFT